LAANPAPAAAFHEARRDTTSAAMMAKCYCRAEDIFMAIEKIAGPHRAPHPNLTSSGDKPNEIERLKISKAQPAGPTTHGALGSADGAMLQTVLDAVEDQRINLFNVLGIVHGMNASFTDATEEYAPEIAAAFDLLEQEIQRVVAGLASLRGLT
jgi:hypothetical protein